MDLDAVLDPVLGKSTIKRGRTLVMKVGDAEVEYDPNFRCGAKGADAGS
jgi:dynein heavy chain